MIDPLEAHDPPPEWMEALLERASALADAALRIGLYADDVTFAPVPTPFGPRVAAVIRFSIGEVAFTKRVQDPEQERVDRQFKEMTFSMGTDRFLDERERMKKLLSEGRSIFDPGDDEQ